MTHYYEAISPDEAQVLDRLLNYAARKGWTVSVYDGEEWTVKRAQPSEIPPHLGSTELDVLKFRKDGVAVGCMTLIYGNSGEELIADHSANDAMQAAWDYVIDGIEA